jgi:hypothetical protein
MQRLHQRIAGCHRSLRRTVTDAPLVALIVSGSLLFAVYRLASAWEEVTRVRKEGPLLRQDTSVVPSAAEIPDDLVAVAMQENETWAQEELIRVIREKHEQYKDWNKVRAAMGLGRRD